METPQTSFHYAFKLSLAADEKFFGPGISQLLQLIAQHGSIRIATREMNMAYSKAWKMLKTAEKSLGFPLLESQIGGKGGGGTKLTPACVLFLENYLKFQAECHELTSQLFNKYFDERFMEQVEDKK